MRALVNPDDGTIYEFSGEAGEFPVATPFLWVDVPEGTVPRQDTWQPDGSVEHAAPPSISLATLPVGTDMASMYVIQTGSGLPMHSHADRGHNCTLLQGAADVVRGDGDPVALVPNEPVSFAVDEPHSITATADNTVIVNITDSQ